MLSGMQKRPARQRFQLLVLEPLSLRDLCNHRTFVVIFLPQPVPAGGNGGSVVV